MTALRSLAVLALLTSFAHAAAPHTPRRDAHGDALPPGAIARLGTLRFWHQGHVLSLAYSPDGNCLASNDHHALTLWDTDGKLLRRWPYDSALGSPTQFAFSPRGDRLAVAQEFAVRVWNWRSGEELPRFDLPSGAGPLLALAFAPDGKTLAVAGAFGKIVLLDVQRGKTVGAIGQEGAISSLAFSPDGTAVLAVLNDETTCSCVAFHVRTGRRLGCVYLDDAHHQFAALSPRTDKLLVVGRHHQFSLRSTSTGKTLHRLRVAAADREEPRGQRAAFSADGKRLVTLDVQRRVAAWDVESGKRLHRPATTFDNPHALAVSPDGRTAAVSDAQTIRRLDLATGEERGPRQACPDGVGDVAFAPDGKLVEFRAFVVHTWDARRGRLLSAEYPWTKPLDLIGPTGGLVRYRSESGFLPSAVYSPDGKRLAFEGDSGASLFESGERAPRWTLPGRNGESAKSQMQGLRYLRELPRHFTDRAFHRPLGFSRDGRSVLLRHLVGSVRAIDASTGRETHVILDNVYPLALSSRGRYLATHSLTWGGLDALQFWHLSASGKPRLVLLPEGVQGTVVAIASDERTLAVAGGNVIWLIETASCQTIRRLQLPSKPVRSLCFSPDGRLLVSSDGEQALVWDVTGRDDGGKLRLARPDALADHWRALAGDAEMAQRAAWALASAGDAALPLLGQTCARLIADGRRVARLIDQLGSDDFDEREAASAALRRMGEAAWEALQSASADGSDLERLRRVKRLLSLLKPTPLTGDDLLAVRVVFVLEQIGTPAARTLLRRIEGHAAHLRAGQEAKAALARLTR